MVVANPLEFGPNSIEQEPLLGIALNMTYSKSGSVVVEDLVTFANSGLQHIEARGVWGPELGGCDRSLLRHTRGGTGNKFEGR